MEFFNFCERNYFSYPPYNNCHSCDKPLEDTSVQLCPDCSDKCVNILVSSIKNDKLDININRLAWNVSSGIWLEQVFNVIKDIENGSAHYYIGEYFLNKQGHDMIGFRHLFKSAALGNKYAIDEIQSIKINYLEDYADILIEGFKGFISLEAKNQELEERIKELEMENIELKYRPNGIGYQTAKEHFESHLP